MPSPPFVQLSLEWNWLRFFFLFRTCSRYRGDNTRAARVTAVTHARAASVLPLLELLIASCREAELRVSFPFAACNRALRRNCRSGTDTQFGIAAPIGHHFLELYSITNITSIPVTACKIYLTAYPTISANRRSTNNLFFFLFWVCFVATRWDFLRQMAPRGRERKTSFGKPTCWLKGPTSLTLNRIAVAIQM